MSAARWGVIVGLLLPLTLNEVAHADWKAGTAKTVITPKSPVWMAGYGGRTKPAEGTHHDLYLRVLALEETGSGQRAVVVSSDTLGFSKPVYEAVVARLEQEHKLPRAAVMLNASHTHCGPVLQGALYDTYPLDAAQIEKIEAYSRELIEFTVATVGKALSDLEPVTLEHTQGTTDFAVNRRTNREADVPQLRADNMLQGPVDHSVPVLAVRTSPGKLKALVLAYACHNTVLDFYQWCGDYAGFAQLALEERYPGATALFVMGCGADQNPLPRRKVELAEKYGLQLADAVTMALKGPREQLAPRLKTEIELVPLALDGFPPRKTLEAMAAEKPNYRQRWAARLLTLPESVADRPYPYPVQAWRLGEDLLWLTLGGEVVVDYSLKFKNEFGYDTWVTAYANDVMAYIPSARVRLEGGYEGQSSMIVYGQPSERWAADVEDRVTAGVRRVVARVQGRSP